MSDDLNERERRALDAWNTMTPPAGFADRVLDAREATRTPRSHRRWVLLGGAALACAAAAAALVVMVRSGDRAAGGTIAATQRSSTRLGDRGIAVAEPGTELTWRVDGSGAADIDQRTGNVFYRVERGEPFVVHTPAGDVRVTGTCFRIEVTPMKPAQKMIASGLAGAAIASAVFVTVYEGKVLAETKTAKTELPAGTRATFADGKPMIVASAETPARIDFATATRDQLVARTVSQQAEIDRLEHELAAIKGEPSDGHGPRDVAAADVGRPWHDPSPETLQAWVAKCHIRFDSPDLDRFTPLSQVGDSGLEPNELAGYNATFSELQKRWKELVKALYIEATGDVAGAETLSVDAMRTEIADKSPDEHNLVLQKLARERAGLQPPPADLGKTTPYERMMRALIKLGDDTESALAKRLGPERASALRGDGWGSRSDMSGCPDGK